MREAGRTREEIGSMLKILTDVVRAYIYIDTFRDNTKEGKVHKARLVKEKAANMRKNGPVFGYNPLQRGRFAGLVSGTIVTQNTNAYNSDATPDIPITQANNNYSFS